MKFKILPPTLRINNRYLVLDIKSEVKLSKDDLVSAIWYGCLRLYGESETSAFNLWLMRFYNIANDTNKQENNLANNKYDENNKNHQFNKKDSNKHNNSELDIKDKNHIKEINRTNFQYYYFKAVLRCQRGYEDKVRGSLAMLSSHNNKKISISIIGISGTIASSIENFIN